MLRSLRLPSSLAFGLKHSFRPALEAKFRDYYYANIGTSLLTVAVVGVVLNVYKLVLGIILVRQGIEEYERRRLDLLWDFQLWACGMDEWTITILEPLLEGGACLVAAICWRYAYGEGRPTRYRQYLLFALLAALLTTVLLVLFLVKGPLGKCATGQLCLVLFAYMLPLRPLVKHCMVMGVIAAGCFTLKILLTGIQCDVIADVAMVSATMWLGVGAALSALERVERAHFVAVQQSLASHNALRALVDRMVPPVMAERLVDEWGGHVQIGENYDSVTVLFCELQETAGNSLLTLQDLNKLFGTMDEVVDSVPGACKIETVGGQYVVAAGVPTTSALHAQTMAAVAMRLRAVLQDATWSTGQHVEMRIGIHSGPIVGGVVGTATPRFRLFGDTINTASRMCSRAACGEILVSHMFVQALGLPARDQPWGADGDAFETYRSNIEMHLTCDGPVAVKGKGMFTVWRLGGRLHPEPSMHACVGAALGDSSVQKDPSDGGNDLFELLVHRQQEIQDEGSVLARQMLMAAAEYRRISSSEPWESLASREQPATLRDLYTALSDMLVRPTDFERHFLRFKAPHMLPAQMVHAWLMVICTAGMFGVDAQELFEASGRGEDVGLLLVVGIGGNVVCLCGMVVLTVVYYRRKQAGAGPVSDTGAAVQDATAVIIWMMTVVFLEVVQAFAKGATISSWAFVIAGFLRTHTLHNLLCNGLALHPQPLGFMVGVCWLLAARVLSHIMWDRRNAAGELVTLLSAQCGATEEWKPRALVSVCVVLIMTTGAYFKRQLLERSAVRQLVATVGLRERVWEIASSLLPPHVIPILEGRASRRASVPGNIRRLSQANTEGGSIFSLSEKHDSVIILHADVVGFTGKCAKSGVGEVFESISMLFNALDDLCRKFELTKIETIGDAYWCSHGLSTRATPADARKMLLFAAALRKIAGGIKIAGESLQVRIGIHVGPMLGGIVGNRFPRYHLFGPHAKVGQVLEQAGSAEASLVSDTFRHLLLQREIISDESPPAAVSAQGRKYLQKVGSSSSNETGSAGRKSLPRGGSSSSSECGLPSESWNVMTWNASRDVDITLIGGCHLPAEIGPVILESGKRNRATHGVVLRRHEGLTQSAVGSLDSAVAEMVLPAWFAFDIENESDDHRERSHPDADVTLDVSSSTPHDANALAGEGGGAVLAMFPDAATDAEKGGNGTVQHVEIDRSTATGFRRLSPMAWKFPFKISPDSSRTRSADKPLAFPELTVARFND